MKHLIKVDANLRIQATASVMDDLAVHYPDYLESDAQPDMTHLYFHAGVLISRPAGTPEHFAYDAQSSSWFDPSTLAELKTRKWEAIKKRRNEVEFGSFEWDGSMFDGNAMATQRIAGSVQMAVLAQANAMPFSIDWTLADNSVRTLSATQMIEVGQTLAQHVSACHAHARQLRVEIEAATTPEQVEAIVW
jgi:hypothetical protein